MANGIDLQNFVGANNKLVETRILFMGRNETTKKVDLYAVGVVENSDLSGLTKRYMNVVTDSNYVKSNSGAIMANMPTDQTDPEATFDFECSIDYNMRNEKLKAGNSSNLFEAIMLGKGFYKGADFIRVIGTNGLAKTSGIKGTKCDISVTASNLLGYFNDNLEVGAMDETGETVFQYNSFRKTLEEVPFALELKTTATDGSIEAQLIPYCSAPNVTLAQSDDTNKMSASIMRCCDIWDMEDSILSGQAFEAQLTDLSKVSFEVDYILQNTGGVNPSDFGVSGDVIVVVDSADGSFTIQTSDGLAWTTSVVGGFVGKAIISSKKLGTGTLAGSTDGRFFLSVTSVGATNNAGFVVNSIDDDSTKDYVFKTYTANRLTKTWTDFVETDSNC